jgi:hypothetical protein
VHQRQVAVLEALQVPHHLRLGVVAVEHRMGKYRVGAAQLRRDRCRLDAQIFKHGLFPGNGFHHIGHVFERSELVDAHRHTRGVEIAQVDALGAGARAHGLRR